MFVVDMFIPAQHACQAGPHCVYDRLLGQPDKMPGTCCALAQHHNLCHVLTSHAKYFAAAQTFDGQPESMGMTCTLTELVAVLCCALLP